jgi:coproporphyrinogen III oxidase-like Fe-S oxidoreductase
MLAADLLGFVTRREGKKFLRLSQDVTGYSVPEAGKRIEDEVSLYIHIPFCRALCPFCCFNRYLFKEEAARAYFRSLKKELDMYIERGYRFSSFYIGGGTPTVLMDELLDLTDYLRKNFNVKEISSETTPPELSNENIRLLQQAGIKRLSVGVQSFNDDVLKAMGRLLCSGEEAKDSLLRAQGNFDTLNVDFIFNFPFQTIETFEADVKAFKEMGLDQATFYPLMPSPHKKSALERRFQKVDNSREQRFYNVIRDQLYRQGYTASTAWCFSREARMIDEYIIDYPDYIGIGSGSVSLVKGDFYVNSFSLERYTALIGEGKLPIIRQRRLSEKEYFRYYLLTKLFGMNVNTARFRQNFGADINRKLGLEMAFLKSFDLVEGDSELRVTERGMYPVSVMMRDFFAALNSLREHCIQHQI